MKINDTDKNEVERVRREFIEKHYSEVFFDCGFMLKDVYQALQEKYATIKKYNSEWVGTFAFFNCWVFTSDMTEDDIYLEVFECTKAEHEEKERKEREERKRKEEEYQAKVPELVEEYVKEATGADWLRQERLEDYRIRVTNIARSFYHIHLAADAVELLKVLAKHKDNKEEAIKAAKELFDNQGHSNNTASITANTVVYFTPYFAEEFYDEVYNS